MKYTKIMRILGITLVLSLLLAIIPATPALAAYDLLMSPIQGKVGDTITVNGSNFPPSGGGVTMQVILYFSDQTALAGQLIGTTVTKYKTVATAAIDTLGAFSTTFVVPSTYNDNSAVTSGIKYIYPCVHTAPTTILNKATLTLAGGDITITPITGPVDTPVTITGSSFTASTAITAQYDGAALPIEGGHTTTQTTGAFSSTVYVPESTAGTHTIGVTVGTTSITSTFTVTRDMLINPQSGAAGTQVTISGTGFVRRPQATFYFNGTQITEVGSYISDSKGSFSATITIPSSGLSAGVYTIEADDGTDIATASFTLNVAPQPEPEPEPEPTPTPTPSTAALDITSSSDTVGALIGIGGTGFTANGTVSIKYDDAEVATATADHSGFFVVTFQAPASAGGPHIVSATDGINTAQTTFTVESVAPDIPPPLLPEMGIKIKSPYTFDWDNVTDLSLPVTYDLEIATNDDFSADSIVFEKTGLETSQYVMTEADELRLAAQNDAYYWRIRAIDGASNPGDWTGAGEFYVSPPFEFPKWALYTLLGIGAVVIFGVGYLLGRRTAFYY